MPETSFGFQGWTIEEVLTDVMGMSNLRTEIFDELIDSFQQAIDAENYTNANSLYEKIDLLYFDAQYSEEEMHAKKGWGHGTSDRGFEICANF